MEDTHYNVNESSRPWGHYKILNEEYNHKTKYIYVEPGKRLSYQKHQHRAEHWFILSGNPTIILNGTELTLSPGGSINVAQGSLHRIIANEEPVEFIEVQTGTYFGEDDIERLDDDFGRVV